MIKLFENELMGESRQSSKGNQLKFMRKGIWYKADYLGYEGLTEYTVSKLLAFSDLKKNEYVDYELEQLEYNGQIFNACKSRDFCDGWSLITLERLFKNVYGQGLNKVIYSIQDHEERLRVLVDQVERTTGVKAFGNYMSKMLTIDSIFLNEDRHTHNMAILTNEKNEFKLAPIFDNGAGLMSDTKIEYPLGLDVIYNIDKIMSKTFCSDFTEQVDIAEKLYGENIHFHFSYNDVCEIVNAAEMYDEEIRRRVIDIVMEMRRRYEYLFK